MSSKERKSMPKVKQWLKTQIPAITDILEASEAQQKEQDIDLILVTQKHSIPCEVKIRYKPYFQDILIEHYSSKEDRRKGWIHASQAKILAYVYYIDNKITSHSKILHLPNLQAWWHDEGMWSSYPQKDAHNITYKHARYTSINFVVPWTHLPPNCRPPLKQ